MKVSRSLCFYAGELPNKVREYVYNIYGNSCFPDYIEFENQVIPHIKYPVGDFMYEEVETFRKYENEAFRVYMNKRS